MQGEDLNKLVEKKSRILCFIGQILLERARTLARRGKLQKAEEILAPLTNEGEEQVSLGALDLLAKIYAQQGRFEEAKALWIRALQIDPSNENFRRAIHLCEHPEEIRIPARVFALFRKVMINLALASIAAGMLITGLYVVKIERQLAGLRKEETITNISPKSIDLRARVENLLRQDRVLRSLSLKVVQKGDVISVVGEVPDLYTRYRVETKIWAVPGVKLVDISQLLLHPTYIVKKGDSLWSIAAKIYGSPTSWKDIAKVNNLKPPYSLHTGQTLSLPMPR
jgi:tetratricopeptide (TPR) repeat protein